MKNEGTKGIMVRNIIMRLIVTLFIFSNMMCLYAAEKKINLQNKRVALFYDKQFPWQPDIVRSLEWYKNTLSGLGLDVKVVNAHELSDETVINRQNFDTVFLPDGSVIPLKSEYSLTAFLANGGNLIVGELQEVAKGYDEQKRTWSRDFRQDYYACFSEWQLRRLKSIYRINKHGGKCFLNEPMTQNAQLPESLQSLLPRKIGPFTGKDDWFQFLDRVNANGEGGPGKDVNFAANILWPVYVMPDGEKTDFAGYRYHNSLLNGSTLVLLGKTGRNLLKTDAAPGVIAAAFQLCELPFPGEQSPEYYKRLIEVRRKLSQLSEQYTAVKEMLSDAAIVAFYQGKSDRYNELSRLLNQLDKEFFALLNENQKADTLLLDEKGYEEQDQIRRNVLEQISQQEKRFSAAQVNVQKEIGVIQRPAKIPVKNPMFNSIRVDAAMCAPIGYYMYREYFFQTLKRLGVNTLTSITMGNNTSRLREYLRDPRILKASEGISFIPSYDSNEGNYSRFNPVTGKVQDVQNGDHPQDNQKIERELPKLIAEWQGLPVYRMIYSDTLIQENGMSTFYWGAQARKDYQAYLTQQYSTIQFLNLRWKTDYKSFADIPVPIAQPQTEQEHGNWEDWTSFRDQVFSQKKKFLYETSKRCAPSVPVTFIMSSTALGRPYYGGNNLYDFTEDQDISGLDGTYLDVPVGEWAWFDLNRGIPVYTFEWGPFYVTQSDPKQWKNKLTSEVWALLSGGAIGINMRIWSYGGCSGNSVDTMGLPTLAGWTLKHMIDQVNQFDHVILDGKRPASIRILYSNTCRRHMQGWSGGSQCKHTNAVDNLYSMFRTWCWPARILAEEALGKDLSSCKLLLVPQAEYLKESTQKQLLDFVRRGGNVLVEGCSGRLDNYGHPSGILFAAAKVQCHPVEHAALLLNGEEVVLGESETTYRFDVDPLAHARILLRYADQSAAVVSCPLGKGQLIFSGVPVSLLKMETEGRQLMEGIGREMNLAPKYRSRDSKLVIREWEYNGQTYLICTYPQIEKGELNECSLMIRGPFKVQDCLLGMEVPSQTDKKDTFVSFVIPAPGIRVFRLDPLTPEQLAKMKTVKNLDNVSTQSSEDETIQMHLPYKGFLYENRPLKIDGYKIEVMVIGKGEAELVVRKGTDTVRRRISADKTSQFGSIENASLYSMVIGGNTLHIYVKAISDILPVGANLEIKETKGIVRKESVCSFQDAGGMLTLQNGLIQIEVNSKLGGRILSFTGENDGINHIASNKGLKVGITDRIWGTFPQSTFHCDIVSNSPKFIDLLLKANEKMGTFDLSKRITMTQGVAAWTLCVEAINSDKMQGSIKLNLHPQLTVGGSADFYDSFYVPHAGGVFKLDYRASAGGFECPPPSKGWAGIVDRKQKVALIEQFSLKEVKNVYTWMGADFYALELFSDSVLMSQGQKKAMQTRFLLIPGMTALDAVENDMALSLAVSAANSKQNEDISIVVETGSAQAAERPIVMETVLLKDGVRKLDVGKVTGTVSFDRPEKQTFKIPGKAISEAGQYTIRIVVADPKGNMLLAAEKKL